MIENIEHLKALMEVATLNMTGVATRIKLIQPETESFAGEVFKTNEDVIIEIRPGLDVEKFYEVWLHETVHIYLGHELPVKEYSQEIIEFRLAHGAILKMTEEERREYGKTPREIEAISTAEALDNYARQKAMTLFFSSDIEARLRIFIKTVLPRGE